MPNRRWFDFLILLLISMFVVSASAAVYYGMLSTSSATVKVAPVHFIAGNDSSGILTLGPNQTYAILALDAYPNVTLYYDQAVNITATANREIRLRPVSISPSNDPSVSNYTSVVFRLIRADTTEAGVLSYTTTGNAWNPPASTSYVSIALGEIWAVKIEITAASGALSGVSTEIVVAVDIR
jgi:hypothetical protein